jgi:hypothetical protein
MEKIVVLYLIFLGSSFALVNDFTINGAVVRWNPNLSNISLKINTSGATLPDSTILSIAQSSASQWNAHSQVPVSPSLSTQGIDSNTNNLYFSDNPIFFSGSGVIAVTQIRKDENTGIIKEADIVLNKNQNFDNNPISTGLGAGAIYLGDVLTHEIGHLYGLGHEQSKRSSMMSAIYRGQSVIEKMDISSIKSMYNNISAKGSISGTVYGGGEFKKIGIFGTYIQAISSSSGDVVSTTFSGPNGSFTLKNLDLNDSYFIATEPVSVDAKPPNYYKTAKINFCTEGNYTLSFYGSCANVDQGLPISIRVDTANPNVNIDALTIGCDIKVPESYKNNKYTSEYELKMNYGSSGLGSSMVGYFPSADIVSGLSDKIRLDLSSISIPGNNYQLEVKIISQDLNSDLALHLNIENLSNGGITNTDFPAALGSLTNGADWLIKDSESNNKFRILARIDLDPAQLAKNNFLLTLSPIDLPSELGVNYDRKNFFPADELLVKRNRFYLLIASIVTRDVNGNYSQYQPREYAVADNSSCLEGVNSFAVTPFVSASTFKPRKKNGRSDGGVGCGTIDLDNGGPGGPTNFLFGLLLSVILIRLKSYAYSRES